MSPRLIALLALLALPAAAQSPPRLTPLGPTQAPRPSAPELPSVQTPSGPSGGAIQSQQLPSLTAPDPAFAPPSPTAPQVTAPQPGPSQPGTPIPGDWQARGTAELVALDKVTARPMPLAVKVGETARFGTLAITVRACAVRGPDQPADATAFLEITDRGAAAPVFRGWMFAGEPSIAVLEHPVYDIRVTGCRP